MAVKTGRKQKPYETSWGEIVPGLARQSNDGRWRDGRWRVVATGLRYTEPDERLAVRLFHEKYALKSELVQVPVLGNGQAQNNDEVNKILAYKAETIDGPDGNPITVRYAHPSGLWGWFREILFKKPDYVAKMTGIPELTNAHVSKSKLPSVAMLTLCGSLAFPKAPATNRVRSSIPCRTVMEPMEAGVPTSWSLPLR